MAPLSLRGVALFQRMARGYFQLTEDDVRDDSLLSPFVSAFHRAIFIEISATPPTAITDRRN